MHCITSPYSSTHLLRVWQTSPAAYVTTISSSPGALDSKVPTIGHDYCISSFLHLRSSMSTTEPPKLAQYHATGLVWYLEKSNDLDIINPIFQRKCHFSSLTATLWPQIDDVLLRTNRNVFYPNGLRLSRSALTNKMSAVSSVGGIETYMRGRLGSSSLL